MSYNINSSYGQLHAIALANRGFGMGRLLIVCPSGHASYDRIVQMFKPDTDGDVRLYSTVGSALAEVTTGKGDMVLVAEGYYNEAAITVTDKNNWTLIGLGGRGSTGLQNSTVGAEPLKIVSCDDVTFINFGIEAENTADYALNLNAGRRFRAFECKFEGPTGTAVLLDGDANGQVGDCLFKDCEFAWCGTGLVFDDSGYGVPTQVFVENCKFHNFTAAAIAEKDAGAWVENLQVTNCVFDVQEGGTDPTDFIVVDHANSTGIFSGNRFAYETNEADVLTIGAKIMWCANATEAGWSTARPS